MTKINIVTQGCSANAAESEIMAGLLEKAGFAQGEKTDADVVLINVCTVKGESTALRAIREVKTQFPHKKIVVAGCVTQRLLAKVRELDEEAGVLNTHNMHNVVEVVEETIHDTPVTALLRQPEVKVGLPRIRKNPVIGIIPILNSCASHCTFCSTKLVKGRLLSYPRQAILAEARRHLAAGCKELWITSQDNGAYMLDKGNRELPLLLSDLCKLPGEFKIRLGMTNPTHIIKMLPEMLALFADPHMYQFLHIPVQSGSNKILTLMKRENTVDEYKTIVEEFKKKYPYVTIATDIIVGFPTETEQDFLETIELIKVTMPDAVNISRFRPRHGTLAARMEGQIDGAEMKRRSRLMSSICQNIASLRNEPWFGWEGEVLVDEQGKEGTWIGRNFVYKQVILGGKLSHGEKIKAKITKTGPYDLLGIVLDTL